MPKVAQPRRRQFPRDPVPTGPYSTSTQKRRNRALKAQEKSVEIDFRYKRCKKENLYCFIDTYTGHYTSYIATHAKYTLFIPEHKWEKVQAEREYEELEVTRLEAELAARRVKLLEVKNKERLFACCDLAVLDTQDKAYRVQEKSLSPGREKVDSSTAVLSRSKPSTNLGQLQADFDPSSFFNPSYLVDLSFLDVYCSTPVLIPYSP